MALTAYGADAALTGAVEQMKWANLFSSVTKLPTGATAIGASLITMAGAKAAGWTNGKMVYAKAVTGAVENILPKRTYFIIGETAEGFELAEEEGGAAIKVAGHNLEAASTEFQLLKEVNVTGKRVATKFKLPVVKRLAEEEITPEITVSAVTEVTHAGWFDTEAIAAGKCRAVEALTLAEKFEAEGKFTLSSDKLESSKTVA
jgi:hypothetical protein